MDIHQFGWISMIAITIASLAAGGVIDGYVLMFTFGAIFGSTIMARMSFLIGRMFFLIHDWLQVMAIQQTR